MRANKPLTAIFFPMLLMTILYMPWVHCSLLVRSHYLGEAWHTSVVEFAFAGGPCFLPYYRHMGRPERGFNGVPGNRLHGSCCPCQRRPAGKRVWLFVICCFFGQHRHLYECPVMAYVQKPLPRK